MTFDWPHPEQHDELPLDYVREEEPTVEGGVGYPLGGDEPGSLGENDWRL